MFGRLLRNAARRPFRYGMSAASFGAVAHSCATANNKDLSPQTTLLIEFDKLKLTDRKLSTTQQLDDNMVELHQLIEALEAAKTDDKISHMIAVTGNGSNIGNYSTPDIEELRRAVKSFTEAKPALIIQENIPSLQALYFSTVFSPRSLLHPRGTVSFNGQSTTTFFAGSLLKKHGIKVDVFRHGLYKSAPSIFSSTGSTRAERENTASIQNCMRVAQFRDILCDRSNDCTRISEVEAKEALSFILDNVSELTADQALQVGLIDGVDEMPTVDAKQEKNVVTMSDYIERQKNAKARKVFWNFVRQFGRIFLVATSHHACVQIENEDYDLAFDPSIGFMGAVYTSLLRQTPTIPVVYVTGDISSHSAKTTVASLRQIQKAIDMGADIKHIVLRVSSPGGDTTSSKLISDQLEALSVPVTVSFGNTAASGGYWIAAKADRIFSNETTRTGSIGVYMLRFDLSKTCEQYGIKIEHTPVGQLADLHNLFHPITPKMKKVLSIESAAIYNEFKDRVAQGRNMTADRVESLAQGRIYTGKQAKENGLVDNIGGLNEAIQHVRHKHGLYVADIEMFPQPEPFTVSDIFAHYTLQGATSRSVLGNFAQMHVRASSLFSKSRVGRISDTTMLVADEETAVVGALKQLGVEENQ